MRSRAGDGDRPYRWRSVVLTLFVVTALALALGALALVRLHHRARFDTASGWSVTILIAADSLLLLLDPPGTSHWVDRVAHVPNLVRLLQCLLALVSASAVLLAVPAFSGPRPSARRLRRHAVWLAVAAMTMIVSFVFSPVHGSDVVPYWADVVPAVSRRTAFVAFWTITFWVAYASAMAHALLLVIPDLIHHQRTGPTRRARIALGVLCAGGVMAGGYILFGSFVVVLRASGHNGAALDWADAVMRICTNLIMPLTFGGLIAFTGAATEGLDVLRAYRDLRRLRPLWRDLAEATAVFEVGGAKRLPQRLENVRLRLYRTVIEIRDGYVAIAPWYATTEPEKVARRLGRPAEDPMVRAVCWELARRSALQGSLRPKEPGSVPAGGATLEEEIALLRSAITHRRRAHRYADDFSNPARPARAAATLPR